MDKRGTNRSVHTRTERPRDYLRRRSQHRIWWTFNCIPVRRARSQSETHRYRLRRAS